MKRILIPIITAFALMLSCQKAPEEVPVASVTIGQTTAEMIIGETTQLTAIITPSNATEKNITWASSKLSVATITSNGLVTAVSEGQSTITASAGGKFATCIVTVSKGFVAVTSVSLNKESLELIKGNQEVLVAIVKPDDATDKTVSWGSSNNEVASVDEAGKVTAIGGGIATITAKSGDMTASCNVTVTVPVESVSLDQESVSIEEESTITLVATVKPDDATKKTITWRTSNAQVAIVDENGTVTAIKEGTATITAEADDKKASCVVTVQKKFIAVTSITLNKTELAIIKGNTETLTATVNPTDATDKTVIWSSSDTAIATVDANGKVTAVDGGSATITAKAGDEQATCQVTVSVPVESVTLNKTELLLNKGASEILIATVKPDNASDKSITWSSSNANVATVSSDGKVTAVGGGSATITAKAGDKEATCQVTVTVPVESVSLSKTSLTLPKGEKATLTATVSPSNATDKSVVWSSTNEGIAKVDQNGNVMAVDCGSTTIIAKAGEFSAQCEVSVVIPVSGITLNNTSLTLNKGGSSVLVPKIYPEDATNKKVTWSSSKTGVATVTDGTVVAVGGGVTEITARTQDGGFEAQCTVTVEVPVTGISLNTNSINIYRYDVQTLKATVYPSDATNKAVSWSSDKPSIVSVDTNGKITGESGGSATITVKTADGDFSAQCYVTVTDDGHQAVDLGLSVKWATTNFGTTSTTAKGGYYMWGDPTGSATAADYSAPNVSSISGTNYDIVQRKWGGNWHIPTRSELGELFTKCTWKQETVNGVSVFRVTGPNGNSIIVPPTGLGYPASGPAGTKQYISSDRAYLMSGNSYSDQYGRFAYVYYYSPDGKYNWESYNADLVYITIRPVR